MFARSLTIEHPSGSRLKTPLLVPSFSSKGFRYRGKKNKKSELRDIFTNVAHLLTETMLISAYDLRYGNLPSPSRFRLVPQLTIVDSGGYEVGTNQDLAEVYRFEHKARAWKLADLTRQLDKWPKRNPAVFVSFDKGAVGLSLKKQIAQATSLFDRYPEQLHQLLIKPTRSARGLLSNMVDDITANAGSLRRFHLIGFTEKELGESTLERMVAIAQIRRVFDEKGIAVPIQVFGALDPVSSCLYFLAGADMFDGLTWLRFAYLDGMCVYANNYGVLSVGVDPNDDFVNTKMFSDNYSALRELQLGMQTFVKTGSYERLGQHCQRFERAVDDMNARLEKGT